MKNKKKKTTTTLKDYVIRISYLIAGLLVFSIGFNLFLYPNNLVFGGVTGLSITIENIFGLDPSVFILACSIILTMISFIVLDKEKAMASIMASLLLPLFIKLTEILTLYFTFKNEQILLSALFGGVFVGFGVGLVYKAGFTTGGTDIINQIIHKYFKISLGKAMLFSDGLIVVSGIFVFGITNFMYSAIVLYLVSLISDKVMLGISDSKAFYIITNKDTEIRDFIIKKLGHGVTIFDAKGGYEKKKENILFCVVPTNEYFKLKEGINEIDDNAFFVATDAYEVYGGE